MLCFMIGLSLVGDSARGNDCPDMSVPKANCPNLSVSPPKKGKFLLVAYHF